eukprot:10992191-Lingulodinium_polyedra.AAC.1
MERHVGDALDEGVKVADGEVRSAASPLRTCVAKVKAFPHSARVARTCLGIVLDPGQPHGQHQHGVAARPEHGVRDGLAAPVDAHGRVPLPQ